MNFTLFSLVLKPDPSFNNYYKISTDYSFYNLKIIYKIQPTKWTLTISWGSLKTPLTQFKSMKTFCLYLLGLFLMVTHSYRTYLLFLHDSHVVYLTPLFALINLSRIVMSFKVQLTKTKIAIGLKGNWKYSRRMSLNFQMTLAKSAKLTKRSRFPMTIPFNEFRNQSHLILSKSY